MPSALHCQTSTAAFEPGAHDAQARGDGKKIEIKGCDVVIFKNGKVAVPCQGCALYM